MYRIFIVYFFLHFIRPFSRSPRCSPCFILNPRKNTATAKRSSPSKGRSQLKLRSRCARMFSTSFFFRRIQLTDATLEKQFRYLLPRESSSRRQARRRRASFLPIPTCPSSFDLPGSSKPQAIASDGGLGKIHQPRESLVLVDVRVTVLSLFICDLQLVRARRFSSASIAE